jgi:hypothetical protein
MYSQSRGESPLCFAKQPFHFEMMDRIFGVAAVLLAAALLVDAGSNDAGIKFLEENKGKDGVITLPSGLQYKVLRKGDGKRMHLSAHDVAS